MTIRSFSGSHPFRPQCLLGAFSEPDTDPAEEAKWQEGMVRLVEGVDNGSCPRCSGPLPEAPVMPSGSRLTACRCIPVCGPCGDHEGIPVSVWAQLEDVDEEDIGWFLDPEERDDQLARIYAAHRPRPGMVTGDVVITADGSSDLKLRPHPGGWAEFGFDDSADTSERQR